MRKYLYLIILCVAFAGCKGSQQKGHTAESNGKESVANSDGKPAVTVTIPPYKFFVDKIAGDKVDVNVMVSNGNNPETYEPYAQQMMELSRSALYLKVGSIGFEQTWMKKLQDNARHEGDRYLHRHHACQDTRRQYRPACMDELQKRPHHLQQHLQGTLPTGTGKQDFLPEKLSAVALQHRQAGQHHQKEFQG